MPQAMRSLQVQDLSVSVNKNPSAGLSFPVLEGHQFHAVPRFLSSARNPRGVHLIKSRGRATVKRGGVPKSQRNLAGCSESAAG